MFEEIGIVVVRGGLLPEFRFTDANGSVPRVGFLWLLDRSADAEVWRLLPACVEARVPPLVCEVGEEADLPAFDELDPIDDPSRRRHRRGLEELERHEREMLLPLAGLTYGLVPDGFRQSWPTAGPPPALLPGCEYALVLMGGAGGHGRLVFSP